MAGVEALKIALDSSVRIEPIDLDGRFHLPRAALRTRPLPRAFCITSRIPTASSKPWPRTPNYCLLSTAITRFAPDQQTEVNHLPVAFLAGRDGLRGDETNYWIFSETGLRTLVDRCGWEVCDWLVVGDEDSVLWNTQRDERVFCLLRSRTFRPRAGHPTGRWLARPGKRRLAMDGAAFLARRGPRRATAESESHRAAESGAAAHPHRARRRSASSPPTPSPIPAISNARSKSPPGDEVLVEFELDRALAPDATDARERAIIVRAIELG